LALHTLKIGKSVLAYLEVALVVVVRVPIVAL
jgi:hypothetical protein